MLPNGLRLKDYKNYIRPAKDFNQDVVNEFSNNVCNVKRVGNLIGSVNLSNMESWMMLLIKKRVTFASHVLVLLVIRVVNPTKFTLVNFPTKKVSHPAFFLILEGWCILEGNSKLKVMAVSSDGALGNRTIHQMHKRIKNFKLLIMKRRTFDTRRKTDFLKMTFIYFLFVTSQICYILP